MNGKITIPFGMEFLDSNGQLPSRKNEGDLLNFVLDKMWERKSAAATKPIDVDTLEIPTNTADGDQTTNIHMKGPNNHPPSWVFKGYIAFYLYTCPILTDPKQLLDHFTTDVELQGENSSRRSTKKRKRLENHKEKFTSVLEGRDSYKGHILQHKDSIAEQIGLVAVNTGNINAMNEL